jgi:hypothetical protein
MVDIFLSPCHGHFSLPTNPSIPYWETLAQLNQFVSFVTHISCNHISVLLGSEVNSSVDLRVTMYFERPVQTHASLNAQSQLTT